MADENENAVQALSIGLSQVYSLLVHTAHLLPIPVVLPTENVNNVVAGDALARLAEQTEEMPALPEEQQAQLYAACIYWLAALDLYGLLIAEHQQTGSVSPTRTAGTTANLLQAEEHAADLADWLARNS